MRKLTLIFGLGTIMLLQSCLVSKEYQGIDNIVQQESYRNNQDSKDTTSLANLSWKEMFTDPILQEHISNALRNNPDNQIALEQIKAAEAYVKQGKANFYPTVSAGLNYGLSSVSKNSPQGAQIPAGTPNRFNLFDISANASWEADIWGKIRSQKRAFEAGYWQTMAVQKAIQTHLVAGIATTYFQLLALDKEIEITKETIELRKTSWETTESLKNAGVGNITSTAVQQTKAQYLDAKVLLVNLENQVRILENIMCVLMGDEPHAIQRSSLDSQSLTSTLTVGVPFQLLSNRPDVVAAENNYRAAFELVNVAKANFYPSLTIGLNGGLQSSQIDNWFSLNSLFGSIIGGIVGPIFNQRKIKTNYELSQIQQEQARVNYRGVLIQSSKEVSDALYNYQSATDKFELQLEQQELLNQAVEDSQELLASGFNNFSYLEVLSAQQNALSIGLAVVDTQVNKLVSIVELYRALGGGSN